MVDSNTNQLTSLDLSNNTALIELSCSDNQFDCEALESKYYIIDTPTWKHVKAAPNLIGINPHLSSLNQPYKLIFLKISIKTYKMKRLIVFVFAVDFIGELWYRVMKGTLLSPDEKFEQAIIDLGLDDVIDGKVYKKHRFFKVS